MRQVTAIRMVAPLREGGSMPALVEADDDGLYVVKLRGAGQGTPVLIAELIAAGLARAAGLAVPELVFITLDAALGKNDPDSEVREVLVASHGMNLGVDFLPGSVTWDPAADAAPDRLWASKVVLFDALVTNPDRSAKNPNLLTWQRKPWLIDHGAALYFQYAWDAASPLARSDQAYARVREHVLLPWADQIESALPALLAAWSPEHVDAVCAAVPDDWRTSAHSTLPTRAQYAAWLDARITALPAIATAIARARTEAGHG